MTGVLTVSTSASPFPYAAIATATYTQKAEIKFDDAATGITLELNGTQLAEDEVVRTLAKAAGLADDSAKVRPMAFVLPWSCLNLSNVRHSHSSSWQRNYPPSLRSPNSPLLLTRWTTILHSVHSLSDTI